MAGFRDFVLDRWSNLSHKTPLQDGPRARVEGKTRGWEPNNWIGEEHRHRLSGYILLSSYLSNVSRHFLDTDDETDRNERREYGDAALIRDQIVSAILGEEQAISVRDADQYDPELDGDPEQPEEGEEPDQDDLDARTANAAFRALAERQEWLQEWAEKVHLELRLVDLESNAVGLGDGVILLGWDERKKRPVPAIMDPGFYFPVIPDSIDSYEYPERVHFAWELPGEDFPDGKGRIRRITYELVTLQPLFDEDALMAAAGDDVLEEIVFELPPNSRWETAEDGIRQVVREYPWRPGETSTTTCFVTDATWILDDIKDTPTVDTFDESKASYALTDDGSGLMRDVDLEIDFLPIVHVPNTPPGGEHYGESSLARVLQILDDIQNADTDAQAASATTGSPITWSSSGGKMTGGDRGGDPLLSRKAATVGTLDIKPGAHWDLGSDGQAGSIDTSANLEATREYVKHLQERLAVNSRIPAVTLGTVKPSEVPSGFAMQLSFGPLSSMIRTMRLVRNVKYALLLQMVQRLAQANGELEPGETPRSEISLGSFLPTDQAGTLTMVREAYGAKLISLETAVTMLLEAGFPIDDVAEEIVRIQHRDYEAANALADATGDQDAVREFLGLEAAAPRPETAVVIDPVTGQPLGAPAPPADQ